MDRRLFLGGLALGALAAAQVAPAQPARKVARIGVLTVGSTTSDMVGPQPRSPTVNALLRGLHELGYVYGEHFVTEARGGEGRPERFPGLAAELVGLRMDVVVAPGPMLSALKQATSTTPIVMAGALDPIAQGLVKSLGQPGGNFTGFSLQSADTAAKRLELVKELVPTAELVAVLWERTVLLHWQVAEAAARERGWKLLPTEIRDGGEIEGAVRAATDARAGALLVLAGGILFPQSWRIAELATKSRLPAIYSLRPQVEAGGLMSYGADPVEIWRRAAVFVDKILKGANPANLPVEQPTKFELVINLKAAKSIGLTIPQSVLLRADDVVQ
jgi:putative ABC transport system substrate-binding protein